MDDPFSFVNVLNYIRVMEGEEERERDHEAIMARLLANRSAVHQTRKKETHEYVGKSIFSKKAEIPWGSSEGKKLRTQAEEWKEQGKKMIGEKKYEFAAALYTDALELATKVCNNEDQIAVLLSNRSYVLRLTKEYQHALEDAAVCFATRPGWFKGPLRMMQGFKAQEMYENALDIGRELLIKYDKPPDEQLKIFTEVIIMADVSDSWEHILTLHVGRQMWLDVVENLMNNNDWHPINVLVYGKDGAAPLIENYDVNMLKLHKLLEWCPVKDWKDWGQRLAVRTLQKGAKKEKLEKEGKYPLHAAFSVGMRAGTYELLKHLFLRYIPSADRDRVDQDGNTLLHLACSNTFLTKDTAIKLLLSHKLEPTLKNKAGKLPIELLAEGDVNHKVLLEDMEERGFNLSSIKTNAVPRPNAAQPVDASQPVSLPQGMGDGLSPLQQKQTRPTSLTASACNLNSSQASRTQTFKRAFMGSSFATYKWSTEDVKKWLRDEHLTEIKLSGLSGSQFTGALLVELKMMQIEAPDFFFHFLQDKLQMPFSHLLKISGAIRNLS